MALTPEERQAIMGLFDSMRETGLAEKDPEAEALINQLLRRHPDSAYMLVQTVLIQEAKFDEYDQYIDDLEARNKELEAQLSGSARPTQGSSGGFLGGARRAAAPDPRDTYDDQRGSGIPPIGSRSGSSPYQQPEPEQPWRGREPSYASSARPGGPMASGPAAQQPPQGGGGGGFLRTAAAMAAGVAGGAMLSNALGGMFGGSKGEAHASKAGSQDSSSTQNEHSRHDDSDNDPGTYDHRDDHGSDDWGSDDIEI
jgi:hypothetical protein